MATRISEVIKTLQNIQEEHGDIPVQLQELLGLERRITNFEDFFIVPEQYDEGWICNLRTWPY
jgi:hypothetical protein